MSSNEEIEIGNFAPRDRMVEPGRPIQVVDWNIDRGLKLAGVIDFLDSTNADLILLQEVNLNANRTHKLNDIGCRSRYQDSLRARGTSEMPD